MTRPTETVAPFHHGPRAAPLTPGTRIDARYEIVRVLGQGGYGVVYLARDERLKREIALKVLRPDRFSESARIRFRREVQVARDVTSPHLVRIFDLGDDEELGLTYLTMEHLEGETLRDRLRDGPLPVDEAVRIVGGVLRGLAQLHAHGVVHRDVKPSNVLLAAGGAVKLADFGLALRWERDETRATDTSSLVGTIEYVSPEQALGQEVGPRSDLYGVGVVLFEALAGRLPHEEASSLGTVLAHIRKRAGDVRRHRPKVSRHLAAVVARLLERRPEDRFASAEEVISFLEGRRGSLRDRLVLFGYRRPRWRAAAALLGTLALFAVLFSPSIRKGLAGVFQSASPPPPKLEVDPTTDEVSAVAADGRVLWTRKTPYHAVATARLRPAEPERVIAFLGDPESVARETETNLQILDLATGEVVATKAMLTALYFQNLGFADSFFPNPQAADLDGDGYHEILVHYLHRTQWPSYTVLYEPRLGRQRIVLAAAGHHRFAGQEDLDGDGELELLFIGINNRLGWMTGLAAVNLVPPLGRESPAAQPASAATPGDVFQLSGHNTLLWYVLLPGSVCNETSCVRIDSELRKIEVRSKILGWESVSFEGLLLSSGMPPKASREEILTRRHEAYYQLYEAQRLLDGGRPEAALPEIRQALAAAAAAGDGQVLEWAQRLQGMIAGALGRIQEAEEIFTNAVAVSDTPGEVAFDAGVAFHLAGHLHLAVRWYERCFGTGGSQLMGRSKSEPVVHLVLALGEMGLWNEAAQALADLGKTDLKSVADRCRVYLRWLRGEAPEPVLAGAGEQPDLSRYWHYEILYRGGEDPAVLLSRLEGELLITSEENRTLVRALLGRLLADAGRLEEALPLLRGAFAQIQADLRRFAPARVHFGLVTRRYADIARQAGREADAAAAEEAYRRWRETQEKRYDVLPDAP